MADGTHISWADATFNPWVGCTKISPACDHCYAESWAKRTGHAELWTGERRRTSEANWKLPLKWNRAAGIAGVRKRVFCSSLADVFDNQVPPQWREDLWKIIHQTRDLDWMLLTKRPQNIAKMLPSGWADGWSNVWLGATCEDQERAEPRLRSLLAIPAAIHFISYEPALGPLDLEYPESIYPDGPRMCCNQFDCGCQGRPIDPPLMYGLDWVICGGESGPNARPMRREWALSMRDQCEQNGVAFHFKQWGEFVGVEELRVAGVAGPGFGKFDHCPFDMETDSIRVGKKAACRLLDGVEHNGYPQAKP